MHPRVLLLLLAVLHPLTALAQNSYGRSNGRVSGQQGALISGAKVTIKQVGPNATATTQASLNWLDKYLGPVRR